MLSYPSLQDRLRKLLPLVWNVRLSCCFTLVGIGSYFCISLCASYVATKTAFYSYLLIETVKPALANREREFSCL